LNAYDQLGQQLTELQHLLASLSLMSWDQETMMPKGGAAQRAKQLATLQGLYHSKMVGELPDLVEKALDVDPASYTDAQQRNLRKVKRDLERQQKLPLEHVKAVSMATSQAFHAWNQAKPADDFSLFAPQLEQLLELKIQETEYYGYEDNPYDAMLDLYEPDLKAKTVQTVFDGFKGDLLDLLKTIHQQEQVDESFLLTGVHRDHQLAFGKLVAEALGYDFNHGRLDVSPHPFTIGLAPSDTRITTMVQLDDIREMLYSTIHEAGHALYEQGLKEDYLGWPQGTYCSLSIHESQSRLWENNVARSLPFWEKFFGPLRILYPDLLIDQTPEDLFKAVNRVQPNLIRISSDELTYHFHILLRFELELALINRDLKVKDLPEAWNAKVKEYLGLDVPSAQKGVLQDIHWSHGSFGYFPTYSLGSFYAAQFMHQAKADIEGLEADFSKGEFAPLKTWLNENIHQHGKLYNAEELCERVTGERLNVGYFTAYAREKFGRVYGLK